MAREEAVARLARQRRFARLRRAPLIPLAIITLIVLTALLANVLTPYSPTDISLSSGSNRPFGRRVAAWRIRSVLIRWDAICSRA